MQIVVLNELIIFIYNHQGQVDGLVDMTSTMKAMIVIHVSHVIQNVIYVQVRSIQIAYLEQTDTICNNQLRVPVHVWKTET